MKTISLARSGITLSLIMLSFMLFRGSTNLINAILVPLTLQIGMREQSFKERVVTVLALFVMIAFFARQQVFFAVIYVGLFLIVDSTIETKAPTLVKLLQLTSFSFVGFWLAIRLTDWLFLTSIEAILVNVVQGAYIVYVGILVVEALVVGIAILLCIRIIGTRRFMASTRR